MKYNRFCINHRNVCNVTCYPKSNIKLFSASSGKMFLENGHSVYLRISNISVCMNFMTVSFNLQVGLIGLVEQEWIDTLATVDPEDIIFHNFVEAGNQLAAELRDEVGTSFV